MSIRVALYHKTIYEYDRMVLLGPQTVRLRPALHGRTPITGYSFRAEPKSHFINWQQDPQGNFLARLVFPNPTSLFSVEVDLIADMTVVNPFDFFLDPCAEVYPFRYEPYLERELRPYLETTPAGKILQRFVQNIAPQAGNTIEFLVDLNRRVQEEIRYVIRLEAGVQSPEETLALKSGSCRDSGWLLTQILRRLGLAARFVSGYLIQLKPDVKPIEGPAGTETDFTDLHAWTEVYLPGAGWVGLDPTSGLLAAEGHIPLAATPEPHSAAPVSGMIGECEVAFRHEMRVTRIHEDPRVTKPYSDEQWAGILSLGDQVDADLANEDVRLTVGGEPTFVSIDDMEGAEWNTAALGADKQKLSANLLLRLRDAFGPRGLLHFGQGKWYPGESLPRWAFSCYWRNDGLPLWRNPRLIADPALDYGAGDDESRRFALELSARMGIESRYVIDAFEDPWIYLQKEQQLPINVDWSDSKLDDPEERERIRRILHHGLGKPVGFVLPLRKGAGQSGPEWQSGPWRLRSGRLFLLPGDSPIGFRLPLSSLPWVPDLAEERIIPADPMLPRSPLPPPRPPGSPFPLQEQRIYRGDPAQSEPSSCSENPVIRTALAVESREGKVCVFMPPTGHVEDYLELTALVEETAAALNMPVLIEGYPPPYDPRLRNLKVTPDPGVIEVNIHPATSWRESVGITTILYEQARLCRLGTEKFMLDGHHRGTGGGNHMVLGGPTPAESPFLRRPDLLRSFLCYWLNHPSLSYLFSSVFVGPTSQACRVDETRPDSVYELEIAFRRLHDSQNGNFAAWMVDRFFRDLLVDSAGNTHRSEFCIDKLYSPDTSSGRLGLVELRCFEMPPDARMSLAQLLLVRALIAAFWRSPYLEAPVRWGTRLHDLFMLPYYVARDFQSVITDLRNAGYPFDPSWYAPHMEFRFPIYGKVCYEGIELELRQAIEPWYVLGEEPGMGGTSRYVDSSLERLQLLVRGLLPERYAVACNGRRLPLHPTGKNGEYVCGVRYRAWQPARCLHPTIPVHTPLLFDVIEIAAAKAIGGCTYHVAHPGGRNYESLPVNSNEAEARRAARFFPFGHTPGTFMTPPKEENPEFPSTLDLRTLAPEGLKLYS